MEEERDEANQWRASIWATFKHVTLGLTRGWSLK